MLLGETAGLDLAALDTELAIRPSTDSVQNRLLRDGILAGIEALSPAVSVQEEDHTALWPEALSEYAERGPIPFGVEVLGIPENTLIWSLNEGFADHKWDGTKDPMVAIQEALLAWEDVGSESGTGTGKSFFGAVVLLWFLASWQGARVFTFAPKAEQLILYIWAEVTKLWPKFKRRFPRAKLTQLRIQMVPGDDNWAAFGYGVQVRAGEESATKAQGMHAEHMLLIYEEAPGVAPAVTEAGKNTCSAPHNLRWALGNPDHQLDGLHLFTHDTLGKRRPGIRHVRISALDHPNVVTGGNIVPGATSKKQVARRLADYGANARLFQSRVRGISPKEAADALIKAEWVERSFKAWEEEMAKPLEQRLYRLGRRAIGVDVANSDDGDEAAIAEGQGPTLLELEAFPCPNANDLGFRIAQKVLDSRGGMSRPQDAIEDINVGVDTVGVGVGAYNEMLARGVVAQALQGGAPNGDESTPEPEGDVGRYVSLRAAMYWLMREDLRLGRVMLKPSESLKTQLVMPKWGTKNRVIWVEPKEEIQDRTPGRKSPNEADAVVYWNWVRPHEPIVQDVPKKNETRAQRLARELKQLDEHDHYRDDDEESGTRGRYGTVLRQG